jgi:hypothetical protein
MPVTSVRGRITENGRPVKVGWIEFVPVDGTIGKLRSARVGADGTFQAEKVAVGLNLIRLINLDIGNEDVKMLFEAFHSPIRRTIPAQPAVPVRIELVDEWNLFRKEYALQRSSLPSAKGAPR